MTHLRPIAGPRTKIPLRHRLPNPPAAATRQPDVEERIVDALHRGPLVVIHGGLDNAATVAVQTMHHRFGEHVDQTVYIDVSALDEDAAVEAVVDVLTRSVGATLGGSMPDYDELVATGIDLAESAEFRVVLKASADAADFVGLIARYARRARWVVVTNRPLADDYLRGQQIAVSPDDGEASATAEKAPDDIEDTLETVGEFVEQKDWDGLAAAFDRQGERWLSGLLARRLWTLVGAVTAPEFASWRLRIAAEIGEHVPLPAPPQDASSRYWYARMLAGRGEYEPARRVADSIGEGEDRFVDARRLLAEIAMRTGEGQRAHDILDALDSNDPRTRAMMATCLAQLDRTDEAERLVDTFVDVPDDAVVGIALARTLMLSSSPGRAGALLERLDERFGATALDLAHGRSLRMMRARLAIYRGGFDEALERLERLRPFADADPALRASIGLATATVRLLTGDVQELPAELGATWLEAASARLPNHFWIAETHFIQLENLIGETVPRPGPQPDLPAPSPRYAAFVELYRQEARLRRGEAAPGLPEVPDDGDLAYQATVSRMRARNAVFGENADAACARAEVMCRRLLDAGYRESAARQLEAITDLDALSGAADEDATQLVDLGEQMHAERFVGHARFHLAVAGARPEELERLATEPRSPVAKRRARWMLGLDVELDQIDRAVVEGWIASGACRCRAFDDEPSGWGLDPARGLVWDAVGTTDLSSSPTQLAFLTVLAERGPETDKQTLIEEGWEIDEYHPLRHDNRLRQTVRKLRQAIEPVPAEPTRILTTEHGYLLGPGFRLAHPRHHETSTIR